MILKILNIFTILTVVCFISSGQNEKKELLHEYYIVEKNNDFQKLVYLKDYMDYKDILYTKVVFD